MKKELVDALHVLFMEADNCKSCSECELEDICNEFELCPIHWDIPEKEEA